MNDGLQQGHSVLETWTVTSFKQMLILAKLPTGKLSVLSDLLDQIISVGDRIVIVSTSTSALDCIDKLLLQPKR